MCRFIGMILVLTTAAIAQSGNNQISGVITYYDQDQQTNVPLKNAHVALETQYPIILQGNNEYPSTYSDDNGYYSFNVGVLEPEIVTIRLYFSNEYIQVQSRGGTRSTSESVVFMTGWPNCAPTPPATECSKILIMDINFDNQSDEAEYATILSMATYAAQFAVARGFQVTTPAKIKYPAEECFVDNVSFVVESAFFWQFGGLPFERDRISHSR